MSMTPIHKLGLYMTPGFAALLGIDPDDLPRQTQVEKNEKDKKDPAIMPAMVAAPTRVNPHRTGGSTHAKVNGRIVSLEIRDTGVI